MGSLDLVLAQVLDPIDQEVILCSQKNDVRGCDLLVHYVALVALLLAFFQLRLFLFDLLSLFIVLLLFFQENVLGVLVSPREAAQNVSSVPAVIFFKHLLQKLVQYLVGESDFELFPVNLLGLLFRRVASFLLNFSLSVLFDLSDHGIAQLL